MKPYSSETSEKIVKSYEQDDTSIRKVVAKFDVIPLLQNYATVSSADRI